MLARLQTKYGQQGLQVVGIATDETNPATVRAFIKKMNFTYPVLWGHGRAVDIARRLGVNLVGLPYTIVIDRHGNVVEKHAGELDAELAHRLMQENLAGAK
jgi:peroxiredoxin